MSKVKELTQADYGLVVQLVRQIALHHQTCPYYINHPQNCTIAIESQADSILRLLDAEPVVEVKTA